MGPEMHMAGRQGGGEHLEWRMLPNSTLPGTWPPARRRLSLGTCTGAGRAAGGAGAHHDARLEGRKPGEWESSGRGSRPAGRCRRRRRRRRRHRRRRAAITCPTRADAWSTATRAVAGPPVKDHQTRADGNSLCRGAPPGCPAPPRAPLRTCPRPARVPAAACWHRSRALACRGVGAATLARLLGDPPAPVACLLCLPWCRGRMKALGSLPASGSAWTRELPHTCGGERGCSGRGSWWRSWRCMCSCSALAWARADALAARAPSAVQYPDLQYSTLICRTRLQRLSCRAGLPGASVEVRFRDLSVHGRQVRARPPCGSRQAGPRPLQGTCGAGPRRAQPAPTPPHADRVGSAPAGWAHGHMGTAAGAAGARLQGSAWHGTACLPVTCPRLPGACRWWWAAAVPAD